MNGLLTKYSIFIVLSILTSTHLFAQGVIFDDEAYKASSMKAQLMRGDYTVPSSASIKKYCPQLGHQLSYSTSVAWAVAWQARTIIYAKNHDITAKDEKNAHVFAPSYIYNKAKSKTDVDCSEGITLEAGLTAAKTYGMPLINDYLYFCGGPLSANIDEKAQEYAISDFSKVFELNEVKEQKIQLVKKTISEGWPVVIGMLTPPSFRRAKEFWQPTERPSITQPGQAMCVVGYDNAKYGGAFEVANSWGWDWGNNGFIWIRYSDFADFVRYAYEVCVVEKEKPYRLKGSVRFQLDSKEEMPVVATGDGHYSMRNTYTSGTKFQLFVTNEDPAFVYVFGSDLTSKSFRIFPHEDRVSPALTYKSNHIAIPDEDHYIQFDNTAGTDFLCVLYSKEELDLESIINKIDHAKGSFYEKVQSVFGKSLINDSVDWSKYDVAFDTNSSSGTAVAVVIEIEHR